MESPFQTTPAGELKHLLNCPSPLYALSVDGTKSRGICPYAGDPLFGHVSLGFARGLQPKSLSECVTTGACPNQRKKNLQKRQWNSAFSTAVAEGAGASEVTPGRGTTVGTVPFGQVINSPLLPSALHILATLSELPHQCFQPRA